MTSAENARSNHGSDGSRDDPASGTGLVLPSAGDRAVAKAFARLLTLDRETFLALGSHLPPAERATHATVARALRDASARDPRGVMASLASPAVSTPLRCVGLRASLPEFRARIDRGLSAAVPHLAAELAARGLLAEGTAIEYPHGAPELCLPGLDLALRAPPEARGLRFVAHRVFALDAAGRACASHPLASDTDRQRSPGNETGSLFARDHDAYVRVGRVTRLARRDHNPIAAFEAHPDKAGNHVDTGGRALTEWRASLDASFELIEHHLPELFREMGFLLHHVIPVGYDEAKHLSASYREAVGTVYLTLHPHVMTMAEALIHEFQHNKLNAASYGADFLRNAYAPLYRSPVRPDPRPLWGILLAVHAFLPVAVLYRRMRAAGHARASAPDFERRLAEIDQKNREGMAMLSEHADWTPAGRALFAELSALAP